LPILILEMLAHKARHAETNELRDDKFLGSR
jgi:hypothetical protein